MICMAGSELAYNESPTKEHTLSVSLFQGERTVYFFAGRDLYGAVLAQCVASTDSG